MNSCAASCCTCSPKASCAFVISASWPTAAAPFRCHSAFSYSPPGQGRKPARVLQPPMVRKIFGVALTVLAPWWSSNDSLPRRNPTPFSTSSGHGCRMRRPSTSRMFWVSRHLRPSASSRAINLFFSLLTVIHCQPTCLSHNRSSSPCRPLCSARANPAHLHSSSSTPFNPHRARVRRNPGRLRSNGFIESAPERPPPDLFTKARFR